MSRWQVADSEGILCSRDYLNSDSGCCSAGDKYSCATCVWSIRLACFAEGHLDGLCIQLVLDESLPEVVYLCTPQVQHAG